MTSEMKSFHAVRPPILEDLVKEEKDIVPNGSKKGEKYIQSHWGGKGYT